MATSPLAECTVTAFRWENDSETYTNVGSDITNELGEYSIGALWQNRGYKLKFDHSDYLVVYYVFGGLVQDLESGPVFYLTTVDLVDIDVTLSLGGSISGTVEGEV